MHKFNVRKYKNKDLTSVIFQMLWYQENRHDETIFIRNVRIFNFHANIYLAISKNHCEMIIDYFCVFYLNDFIFRSAFISSICFMLKEKHLIQQYEYDFIRNISLFLIQTCFYNLLTEFLSLDHNQLLITINSL